MLTGKYGRESPDRVLQTRPSQVSPQISRRHPTRGWAPPRDRRSIFEDPEPSGLAVVDRESDRAAHPWRQERQAGSEQRSRPQLLVESRRSRRPERCDSSLEGLTPGPAIRGSIDPCRSNDSKDAGHFTNGWMLGAQPYQLERREWGSAASAAVRFAVRSSQT